jgi:transposase
MKQEKYIGMDVHQATISVAVLDGRGKPIMECILETKAATILEFVRGLQGDLSVTFEEGTSAAWLHDLLKPHVAHLVVCDPRKNALLKDGSKSDRIDARKLAELLHGNKLHAVYHGEHGVRTLKELGRSYLTITQDLTRIMNRIKALYRSWAIPCSGATVYATGSAAAGAPESAPRPIAGESQTSGREVAAADSCDRSDSCGHAGGVAADATPFPHQAPAVGLQWGCGRRWRVSPWHER